MRVALDSRDQLGEGPIWDGREGELLRVDIARGRVLGWSPSTGSAWSREHDGEVSAVVPRAHGRGRLLAIGHRILLDDGDRADVLATVEDDQPGNRFNDCKCDPQGRLWVGTMSKERAVGAAALYRLSPGAEIERVVAGTTISNGLAWSPAGDRMYFIDSTTQRVDVFDFDARTGAIADRRTFAEIDPLDGLPDGMTVDAEGGVWVCLFGGAAVRRYGVDGRLDAVIALPVTNPTSPAFGGSALRTLYVTSARHRLSAEQLRAEPLAGAVLAIEPGVAGLPGNRFAG
ncbi:MAG: SMP-30/gluconolactonase/LRE family protein [Thermoleophilaceae bacterium]|nr:SMP-30/gluconolactonase/LRE family protein [Thermoleophilaceae bacterium]